MRRIGIRVEKADRYRFNPFATKFGRRSTHFIFVEWGDHRALGRHAFGHLDAAVARRGWDRFLHVQIE